MAPRVNEPSAALAVLVLWRPFLGSASRNAMFVHRVAALDVDHERHRTSRAVSCWVHELHLREVVGEVEHR